jgi:hypothetical protein
MTARSRWVPAALALLAIACAPARAADLSDVERWTGKEPSTKIVAGKTLWDQKGVQEAMRAALGERTFALARKTLLSGPQSPVAGDGHGAFVAWSCKAHDCGDNQISLFFDSTAGTAQACLRISDRSGRVEDLWLANGKARPLPTEACLSTGNDPFALLQAFGPKP